MGQRELSFEPHVHEFDESLRFSHAASDLPFWEECYRHSFPDFQTMIDHRQDGPHQRAGIDRSVVLKSSRQILIDEKVRGRNKLTGKVYSDIAIEIWSDVQRRRPGWIQKSLLCDFIAYAIAPLGVCYLLPFQTLKRCWIEKGEQWKKAYGTKRAENRGYQTEFCAVPWPVLASHERDARVGKFRQLNLYEDNGLFALGAD